jgi:DNA-binding NarL/FixJ family response regulator
LTTHREVQHVVRPNEFVISGRETLLEASIAALVREAHPQAAVRTVSPSSPSRSGVRVLFSDTGRWLHVATADGPDADTVQALADGAATFVTTACDETEFRKALDGLCAAAAEDLSSRTLRWVAERAVGRLGPGNEARQGERTALTARERTVLRLLAEGLSTLELAGALDISANTVRAHVRSLSMKLEASGRARLLAAARAQGFPEAFAASGQRAVGFD